MSFAVINAAKNIGKINKGRKISDNWCKNMSKEIKKRLKYLKEQIDNENISYGEIAELQSLAKHIDTGDVKLLEWAGVEEN